jgi:hypothetical protein
MAKVASPLLVEAGWANRRIELDWPFENVSRHVRSGEVVILRHALPDAELLSLRRAVHTWGQQTLGSSGSVRGNNDLHNQPRCWHGLLAWPHGRQPPLRLWHGYAFVLGGSHPADATITSQVRWMFDAMRDLHQRLTGMQTRYRLGQPEGTLRPQIMHYPSGGGARVWERHSGDPTVISQIVALSERGSDFHVGGNVFETGERLVDTSGHHDLGDICLFRSDLWHAVTPVDPAEHLDFGSERGRWTAVLPLVASR